jgi:hypothetical protein
LTGFVLFFEPKRVLSFELKSEKKLTVYPFHKAISLLLAILITLPLLAVSAKKVELTDYVESISTESGIYNEKYVDPSKAEIIFPEELYDPVWVIWFNWDGDPYECKVMGVKVTDNSMTVIAHDKICNDEVTCSTPFELGAKNIDWLYEIYDAVWQQLEENGDNNA